MKVETSYSDLGFVNTPGRVPKSPCEVALVRLRTIAPVQNIAYFANVITVQGFLSGSYYTKHDSIHTLT